MISLKKLRAYARLDRVCCLAAALSLASAWGQVEPQAGSWKTWVLKSGSELRLAPPPEAAGTAQESAWLKEFVRGNTAESERQVRFWSAGSPSYRWVELATTNLETRPLSNPRGTRFLSLLNVAIYDAMVAAWDTKYTYNRQRPSASDPTLKVYGDLPQSPSYPSEHAVAAGAAAEIIAYAYPADKAMLDALAEEAARSRLHAGVNYPSDTIAGLQLGRDVARRVLERAAGDGSSIVWSGTVPTGAGLWRGTNPVEPLHGNWKTWAITSGAQFRPAPPPAADSALMRVELDEMRNFTRTFATNQKATFYQAVEGVFTTWYQQAHQRIFEQKLDSNPPRAAQAYALMAITQYDASVACWEAKYTFWSIRPFMMDPAVNPVFTTPNHPSYPAGHGCYSGGIARMIEYLFPDTAGALDRKADEAAESRFWGGIHFRSDLDAGLKMGRQVADVVWAAK